jgi:hypothetical protein
MGARRGSTPSTNVHAPLGIFETVVSYDMSLIQRAYK